MRTVHSHPESMPMGSPLGGEAADRELRVLVVDDHPAVRTGVLQLLEERPDLSVVDAVGSAEAAMVLARADRCGGGRLSAGVAQRSVAEPDVQALGPGASCGDVFGVLRRSAIGGVRGG